MPRCMARATRNVLYACELWLSKRRGSEQGFGDSEEKGVACLSSGRIMLWPDVRSKRIWFPLCYATRLHRTVQSGPGIQNSWRGPCIARDWHNAMVTAGSTDNPGRAVLGVVASGCSMVAHAVTLWQKQSSCYAQFILPRAEST